MPEVVRWRKLSKLEACSLVDSLTARETETAWCLALGMPRERICRVLGVAPKTLDIYLANVRRKLCCETHGVAITLFMARGFQWPAAYDGAPDQECDKSA